MNVVGYCRVSGLAQVDGDGFPRQCECIERYCEAHGMTLIAVFVERAVCGGNDLENRPAMLDALAFMRENGITHFLVEDFRRFARDLVIQELLIREFARLELRLIDCTTDRDMTVAAASDPTAVLIRQILGAVAQWERLTTVIRLRAARRRRKRDHGRCEGPPPFGHDPKRPAEEICMDRILTLSGTPQATIAATLNNEGFQTRKGRQWTARKVCGVLKKHGRMKTAPVG